MSDAVTPDPQTGLEFSIKHLVSEGLAVQNEYPATLEILPNELRLTGEKIPEVISIPLDDKVGLNFWVFARICG